MPLSTLYYLFHSAGSGSLAYSGSFTHGHHAYIGREVKRRLVRLIALSPTRNLASRLRTLKIDHFMTVPKPLGKLVPEKDRRFQALIQGTIRTRLRPAFLSIFPGVLVIAFPQALKFCPRVTGTVWSRA